MGRKNTRESASLGRLFLLTRFFAAFSLHRLQYLFVLHTALPICIHLESERLIILTAATPRRSRLHYIPAATTSAIASNDDAVV